MAILDISMLFSSNALFIQISTSTPSFNISPCAPDYMRIVKKIFLRFPVFELFLYFRSETRILKE